MNNPATPAEWTRAAGALLGTMRTRAPLVHCLTNHVVTNFTANVLLAAGAAPDNLGRATAAWTASRHASPPTSNL